MYIKTFDEVKALEKSIMDTDVIIVDGGRVVSFEGVLSHAEAKAEFRAFSSFTETELRGLADAMKARRDLLDSQITDEHRMAAKRSQEDFVKWEAERAAAEASAEDIKPWMGPLGVLPSQGG